MFSKIIDTIKALDLSSIAEDRKQILLNFADLLSIELKNGFVVKLNFICTHNSRRSHLAQVWAQTLAYYFKFNFECFSGGTESTAVYPLVIDTLIKQGFKIRKLNDPPHGNSLYFLEFTKGINPLNLYSKTYDFYLNPNENFIAVMTCSDADENCPIVSGAKHRFALTYDDPKVFDGTEYAEAKYLERSIQIATELCFVFQHITKSN